MAREQRRRHQLPSQNVRDTHSFTCSQLNFSVTLVAKTTKNKTVFHLFLHSPSPPCLSPSSVSFSLDDSSPTHTCTQKVSRRRALVLDLQLAQHARHQHGAAQPVHDAAVCGKVRGDLWHAQQFSNPPLLASGGGHSPGPAARPRQKGPNLCLCRERLYID